MSVIQRWNPTDLAKATKVSRDDIVGWYLDGHLEGEVDDRGILRLPISETVAVEALRDGKDPAEARAQFFYGRDLWRAPDTAARRTKEETENTLQDFLVANRLPQPERRTWGDGDPRKEVE